jgi:hypothetical protein
MRRELLRIATIALTLQLGCSDSGTDGGAATAAGAAAPSAGNGGGASGGAGSAGAARSGESGAAAGMSSAGAAADDGGGGGTAGAAGASVPEPACDPTAGGRVSKPGEYQGYSDVLYEDYALSSFYVEVRDGTRLALDLFRPTDDNGDVVSTPLPVLWMHTPYNRRNFTTGLTAQTYPGFALRLVKYGYVVAIVDFRGLYASFGRNLAFNRGEWIDAARMDAYDITEWLAAHALT